MKHYIQTSILILASLLSCNFTINAESLNDSNYNTICKDLDETKNTSLYVDTKWKDYTGQSVNWTGKIYDVKGGRGKAVIYLIKSESKCNYKYNIILYTTDLEAAATLRKKEIISFEGTLFKYKPIRNGGTIFYLKNGTITKQNNSTQK